MNWGFVFWGRLYCSAFQVVLDWPTKKAEKKAQKK
jgi:hypothetical protein